MELWLTRRQGGLYMLTYLPPVISRIKGSQKLDAYFAYGEPIGMNNLCELGVFKIFGIDDLPPLNSTRVSITGAQI